MKPGITAHIPLFCALNSESVLVFVLKPQTSVQSFIDLYGIEQSYAKFEFVPLMVVDY